MITWHPHAAPLTVAMILIAGGVWLWWLHRRLRRRWSLRQSLALLIPKGVVLLLLVLALLDPGLRSTGDPATQRSLVLLIDQSASMDVLDAPQATRQVRAGRIAAELADTVGGRLRIERRWFDTALHEQPTSGGLRGTDLGACLQNLARSTTGTDCAGIVVISDGGDEPVRASGLPSCPIAAVGIGGAVADLPDVAITQMSAPDLAERGVTFEVVIDGAATGPPSFRDQLSAVPVVIERRVGTGAWQMVERTTVDLRAGRARATIRCTEAEAGTVTLRATMATQRGEATTLNNLRTATVEVRERSLHVLYFSRSMGVDFKLLRGELARDAGITFTALYRTLGERFQIQGDRVSGDQDLSAGFPKDDQALARYEVIILGSFAADSWSRAEQQRLADWITKGGALVLMGGDQSFGRGGYCGTPLESVMPWVISADEPGLVRSDMSVSIPPAAMNHPVMRGVAEALAAAGSPTLASMNRPGALRPGALPLMTAEGQTLIAWQPFGKGRVLGIATDTLWRLAKSSREGANAYGMLWRQAARALTDRTDGGAVLRVTWDQARYRPGETATATVRIDANSARARLDAWFTSDSDAATATIRRDVAPQSAGADLHTVLFPFAGRGAYTVHLTASQDGAMLEEYQRTFTVAPLLPEGARLAWDQDGLQRLSEAHGGVCVHESALQPLITWLDAQAESGRIITTQSLVFSSPWWLSALMGALIFEWMARRRRNLL